MRKVIIIILTCLAVVLPLSSCVKKNNPKMQESEKTQRTTETQAYTPNSSNEISMLPSQDIRIMSMNMSYEVENMKERSSIAIPLILSFAPDSIGTQENGGRPGWPSYFEAGLPSYKFVGRFSNGNILCEDHYMVDRYLGFYVYNSANYIYYNADKYNCLDWNTVWLSETPLFKSQYKGGLLRTCTWAIFEDKNTGFRYAHVNCHLGYDTDELNMYQIRLVRNIAEKFIALGLPTFITGDFNTREGGSSYKSMTASPVIFDSKYLAENKTNANGTPIDFIFVSDSATAVHEHEVINTEIDGYELSDHNWVFAHATVKSLPDSYKYPSKTSNTGMEITEIIPSTYICKMKFSQADDITLIDNYFVEIFDNNGNTVLEKHIPSRHLDLAPDKVLNCWVYPLLPESEYTAKIYAVDMIGTMSEPIVQTFTTSAP